MKLNRTRLRRLIKKEIRLLNEGKDAAIDYLMDAGNDVPFKNASALEAFADALSVVLKGKLNISANTINGLPPGLAVVTHALAEMGLADGKTVATKFNDQDDMQAIGDDPDFYNAPEYRD